MSTEVKPTDWDAEDNRWEPTPSGGGSGLPPFTSADKGKVLTVGEDVEPKWEAAGGIEVISIGSVTASNGADNAIYVNGQELTTLEECAEYLESVQDKVLYVQMTGLPEGAIFKSIVTGITVYRAANYAYGEFVQKMPSLKAQTFGYMPASD